MKTNQPTSLLDYKTTNFAALLDEGLFYVEQSIPTFMNNTEGNNAFISLLSDKLEELCIPHKIFDVIKCNNPKHKHLCICIDGSMFVDGRGIINAEVVSYKKYIVSKEELSNFMIEDAKAETVFDNSCIPLIKSKLDEIFINLGDYQPGSLVPTRDLEPTEKTKDSIRKEVLKKVKNDGMPEELIKKLMKGLL